jgi:predicted transcriptional regulator
MQNPSESQPERRTLMTYQTISHFDRARVTDPWTSHAAAEKVANDQHFERILNTLRKHGPLGKDGIAKESGLRPDQVWRRLSEMEKIELIRQTGQTVRSDAGRQEREWCIND